MDPSHPPVPEYDVVFDVEHRWDREEHNVFNVEMEDEAGRNA